MQTESACLRLVAHEPFIPSLPTTVNLGNFRQADQEQDQESFLSVRTLEDTVHVPNKDTRRKMSCKHAPTCPVLSACVP